MSTEAPFLAIEAARFAYGDDDPVVADVDWSAPAGAFHCLVGRSGCGKTTLLKLVAGLLQPTAGAVRLGGAPVLSPSRQVGFVFQTPSLLEWLPALDNVLLPISLKRPVEPADRARAVELMALAGVDRFATRYPRQLSGGQQSRVALARALIGAPPALLMDEPFAALDAITREELQDDLLALTRDRNTTVLFVTHDIAEAVYLGDRVAVMERGRIRFSADVALPKARTGALRHMPEFNAICRTVRAAMTAKGRADGA